MIGVSGGADGETAKVSVAFWPARNEVGEMDCTLTPAGKLATAKEEMYCGGAEGLELLVVIVYVAEVADLGMFWLTGDSVSLNVIGNAPETNRS